MTSGLRDGISIRRKIRTMSPEQKRIVARLRRLVEDAAKLGVELVADADGCGVRVMGKIEADGDLRGKGVLVRMHNACGSGTGDKSGSGTWL